jgi:hypothetical protein
MNQSFVRKPEERILLGSSRYGCEDNMETDMK